MAHETKCAPVIYQRNDSSSFLSGAECRARARTCYITSIPDDVLCGALVPECRVLLMARTCRKMRDTLERQQCAVDIRVSNRVSYDARLVRLVPTGVNNLQLNFRIRRFECFAHMRFFQLKFSDFEELALMHLRTLRMHSNQMNEVQLMSLLYMLTFSGDMRTFEFTEQGLRSRHVPCLAHSMSCFGRLETLNLDKNYLIFDSLGVVLDAVQTSTLTTLNLATNSCEDAGKMLQLSRVVRMSCSALKTLNLSCMRLCVSDLDVLLESIGACTALESLDLSKNHLHYGCLTDVLNATAACPRLRSFGWAGNRLGPAGTFVLANHIMHNQSLRGALQELNLRMCDVCNGLQYLAEALVLCTSLHTLDISNNSVYSHEVARILTNAPIASLDISSNYISDYGMRHILDCVMRSRTLKDLHVLGNHMSKWTIRRLRHIKSSKRMTVRIPRKSCPCNTCMHV
jgi:hypothetical protein